jgi:hypothetical protein
VALEIFFEAHGLTGMEFVSMGLVHGGTSDLKVLSIISERAYPGGGKFFVYVFFFVPDDICTISYSW